LLNNPDEANQTRCKKAFDHALNLSNTIATAKIDDQSINAWLMLAREKWLARANKSETDTAILREINVRNDESSVKHGFVMAFYFLLRLIDGSDFEQAIRHTIE
jgi:hypothetical protein